MKTYLNIRNYLLLLFLSLCFASCKKEKTDVGNPNSHVNWRINSTNYTSNRGAFVSIVSGSTTQVYAVSSGGSNISLNLTDCNAPGIWIAANSGTPGFNAGVYVETAAHNYESSYNSGSDKVTINISQVNAISIKGTFNGIITTSGSITASLAGDFEVFF